MTEPTPNTLRYDADMVEEDRNSLLDLLLVVTQNLKLLIVGPVLAGLLALGVGYVLPQSFTSAAIISLPTTTTTTAAQAAAMMVSPIVLDPVIENLQLTEGKPVQVARLELAKQINASVGKDALLRLDVTDHSPVQAQTIANAVIDNWLKSTVPGAQEQADLQTRLDYAKTSLASVRGLLERLTAEGSTNLNKPLTRGEAGTSIIAVGELQARYLTEVLNIPRTMRGLPRDVVAQPPTLPTEPVAPKKARIAVMAALGSGFALLLFVFIRQALRSAGQAPASAEKVALLRRAWAKAIGRS